MKDYIKVNTRAEQEAEENDEFLDNDFEEVDLEEKQEGKFKRFLKKNWKKILIGAGMAASFVGGCVVGDKIAVRKYGKDDEDYLLEDYGNDGYDVDDPELAELDALEAGVEEN